jgi:hypothetical protein
MTNNLRDCRLLIALLVLGGLIALGGSVSTKESGSAKATAETGYLRDPNENSRYASNLVHVFRGESEMIEALYMLGTGAGLFTPNGRFVTWRIDQRVACMASVGSKVLANGSGPVKGTVYGEHHDPYDVKWNATDVTIIEGSKVGCRGLVESEYVSRDKK